MKIYVNDELYKHELKSMFKERIDFVDTKNQANLIISGRFTSDDYSDQLKAVIIPYTGHDQIDVDTLKKHDVLLFNTTVHSKFVAEKALQLILALLGNTVYLDQGMRHKNWHRDSKFLPWTSLFNQRVGIYGYGRIGQLLHDLMRPFNVSVYVIDRGKDYQDATPVNGLSALIEHSDILVIAAPLNEYTEDVFNDDLLSMMENTYLVNVGRGPIINEKALYNALENETLKGFASDVWYTYPQDNHRTYPSHYPIHMYDNVVLSPHCGGRTTTSKQVMMQRVIEHVKALLNNDTSSALDLNKLN